MKNPDSSDRNTSHIDKAVALRKQQQIESMLAFVYDRPDRQWQDRLDALVERNNQLAFKEASGIVFRGDFYLSRNAASMRRASVIPLDRSLMAEMQELIEEKRRLQVEKDLVQTFFVTVLNVSPHSHHHRSLLPDCVHPALPPIPLGKEPLPLSPEHIKRIQDLGKDAVMALKRRLALNLIT